MSLIAEHAADPIASDLKSTLKTWTTALNRWFYPFAGLVMLALTVIGFQLFYFKGQSYPGRPITPPIRMLVIAHGLSMSLWIVLFAVQPMLVALRRRRLHMALGRFGAMLALVIVVLGVVIGIASARVSPPEMVIWGLTPARFMAVPLISVAIFGVCVAVGVWKRRKPDVHRAAMLLGTLATISAAVSRIDAISHLYTGTVWERVFGPFFTTLLIGAALVAVRCVLARNIERPLVVGFAALSAASWGILALARTDAWMAFATLVGG